MEREQKKEGPSVCDFEICHKKDPEFKVRRIDLLTTEEGRIDH